MLLLLLLVPIVMAQKECLQGRDSGELCDQPSGQRFFFDKLTKRCQPFYYKGCNGNSNNFATRDECSKKCSDIKGETAPKVAAVCKSGAYAAGATSFPQPLPCSECPKGYECEGEMCCPKKEYLCNLQYDAGKFGDSGSHRPRYFFSKSFKNCMIFTFYGRDGNANNFETYNECKNMCMS
ncbi:unnamed protein product [Heligmosomoides polygyrus]|uniref:Kunitz/Bovine pancreatic trypsin inhibitor domain protein n=1 Tax=Heligmosomoides polygyrus TaxID=6339 RepID=A0A183F2Z8_HELPZ|nr:unnamed protein product [Heligmosomoides polygyrus]